ncbi:Uncharacterised protein [Mycobacteroides abscessus subsp. massiliense]|nr:Uncharacterised protein [Mycobacteroides abscessus subsp. massiliense]
MASLVRSGSSTYLLLSLDSLTFRRVTKSEPLMNHRFGVTSRALSCPMASSKQSGSAGSNSP